MNKIETKKISLSVRNHIGFEDIKNLLDNAGNAARYWAASELMYESQAEKALTEEGVEIQDMEGGDDINPKIYVLNLKKIKRGLTIMAKKYPKHFADFLKDDADGDTGDVFLQCCVFGEVIYG